MFWPSALSWRQHQSSSQPWSSSTFIIYLGGSSWVQGSYAQSLDTLSCSKWGFGARELSAWETRERKCFQSSLLFRIKNTMILFMTVSEEKTFHGMVTNSCIDMWPFCESSLLVWDIFLSWCILVSPRRDILKRDTLSFLYFSKFFPWEILATKHTIILLSRSPLF